MAIQIRRGTDAEWESNKSNIVAGEPAVAMDTERMFIGTGSGTYMEVANIEVLADAFDSSASYVVGDFVSYHGKVYKFTSTHSGAWNASDVEEVALADALDALGDDVYTKAETDSMLALKADASDVLSALALKADKSDTYTKTEVNTALDLKADKSATYTKTEVDSALALKADKNNTFVFQGYLNELNVTRLKDCLSSGWYACGASYAVNITDLPSDFPTNTAFSLKVYRRGIGTNSTILIRQEIYGSVGYPWIRIVRNDGVVVTDWSKEINQKSFMFRGYLDQLGVTALSTCKEIGWYSCGAAYVANLTDLPSDFPTSGSLQLKVYEPSAGSATRYVHQELVHIGTGALWYRLVGYVSQGVVIDWTRAKYTEQSGIKACIIGASIEAGTTHETASSSAVVDASKAYLTVALQNNGITVTNKSHGGMGYIRNASDGTVFKNLIDNTDFSAFDSCYICVGSNDWNYNQPLGDVEDTVTTTVCGMLRYTIEKIYTSNPNIKLFIKTPDMRATRGSFSTLWGWNSPNEATVPYTLKDLHDAIHNVCSSYGVEVFGERGEGIVNAYNVMTVYPDGSHPTKATMAQMAKNMTGRIKFK